jgi:hypothetical protein
VANSHPSGISCQFVAILCTSWSGWIFILVALAASIAANALLQKGPWGHGYRGAGSVLEGKIINLNKFPKLLFVLLMLQTIFDLCIP